MPENVRDRDELLLNAIVTGDTSGIDPRDREETFIKAIAEKAAGSKYAFATTYEFTVDASHNILKVKDAFGVELDFSKIKPRDLLGSMVVIGSSGVGYVFGCTMVTSETDVRYYAAFPTNSFVEFNSCALNFDAKTISSTTIISLS